VNGESWREMPPRTEAVEVVALCVAERRKGFVMMELPDNLI